MNESLFFNTYLVNKTIIVHATRRYTIITIKVSQHMILWKLGTESKKIENNSAASL